MRDRFIARARQRERRDRQFTDPGEARQLVAGADFDIHSCSLLVAISPSPRTHCSPNSPNNASCSLPNRDPQNLHPVHPAW